MSYIFDVSGLNQYVANYLSSDPTLSSVSVKGEISGFKKYPSGHLYFSLKDDKAQISCVAFRGNAEQFGFLPENGISVLIRGRASLYERDGRFQLIVYQMEKDGLGDLFVSFENLKRKLDEQGLFDPERKKPIPYLPRRIGVISSPKGAVISDMIHILSRRYPNFNLLLYPSSVQGESAPAEIISGIRWFEERKNIDVLIIARGGGSMEDLWCFNDEALAYAIYQASVPVISAVGHETDFTLCDFVSDLRAPTPSAAAELVMPLKRDLTVAVKENKKHMDRAMLHLVENSRQNLRVTHAKLEQHSPERLYEKHRQYLDILYFRMKRGMEAACLMSTNRLEKLLLRLDVQSPLKRLSGGFGFISDKESQKAITSVRMIKKGQKLCVDLADGQFITSVEGQGIERKGTYAN